jgi:dTDP-4-amino-4,6-dideoxygalactose transaminase
MVPVADPARAVRAERPALERALRRVLDSGRYVLDREVQGFENELAAHVGVDECVGVASGTDALELALRAVGCAAGDEVVTAANAGFYASAAALAVGMRVRYADVDPASLTVSVESVEDALTPTTAAVVVTHLYGLLADVEAIVALCRRRGVKVVEDCAQAAGARRGGRRAGSFGDAAAFSFYPTKNLAALGDGGAVATSDTGTAGRARMLRQYGWESKYRVAAPGGRNSRLDELQAAILRARLPLLDVANDRRRAIVRAYEKVLAGASARLVTRAGEDSAAHLAVVVVDERDSVRAALAAEGVGTDVHYPVADHRQPVWGDRHADVRLPVTEEAVDRVLTIPCYPELTDEEVERVADALRRI